MNRLIRLVSSTSFYAIASVVSVSLNTILIFPLSRYVSTESVSVVHSFGMVAGFMLLLLLSSLSQMALAGRLLWGRQSQLSTSDSMGSDTDIVVSMRSMRATVTKMSFILGALLVTNTLVFDALGKGVLVTGTYRYHVLTRLRSSDPQTRADAVPGAIQLIGDERVAGALLNIIRHPGGAREWAAYALGVRRDRAAIAPLAELVRTGTPRERAAAAIALARLRYPGLVQLALEVWPKMEEYRSDLLIALGIIGKERIREETLFSARDLTLAGEFLDALVRDKSLAIDLKRLAIWGLNRFESPEGLPFLEDLLTSDVDTQTLCIAIEALGNIGAADSSPHLVSFLYRADKAAQCEEMVASDFTGGEVLLCRNSGLVARVIYEIARIGDHRAVPPLSRLSEDDSFDLSVRNLAKEFVYRMQYAPPR